jgi:hypothetical protein
MVGIIRAIAESVAFYMLEVLIRTMREENSLGIFGSSVSKII